MLINVKPKRPLHNKKGVVYCIPAKTAAKHMWRDRQNIEHLAKRAQWEHK